MSMAIGLGAIGGVASLIGGIMEGEAKAQSAEYNAKVGKINAQAARDQGKVEVQKQRRDNTRVLGKMRAQFGASGLAYSGSLLDVFEDSYAEGELDVATIKYNSEVRAIGYENGAALDEASAGSARASGILSGIGGLARGVASGF